MAEARDKKAVIRVSCLMMRKAEALDTAIMASLSMATGNCAFLATGKLRTSGRRPATGFAEFPTPLRCDAMRGAEGAERPTSPRMARCRWPAGRPDASTPSQLLKGFFALSDGDRIGSDLISPVAGLEPILAVLFDPAISMANRNPAIEKIQGIEVTFPHGYR